MSAVIACHQPNFLPWLGFFAKIARSDVFFLLDDVQFTQGPNRHNWTSRVRIGAANGPLWLSQPVRRSGVGPQRIIDLQTDERSRWLPKMINTLTSAYNRAPYARACLPVLIDRLSNHDGALCEINIALIGDICSMLGLNKRIIRSSTRFVDGVKTERLINLTLSEAGRVYLSGDGADDYQVVQQFHEAGIAVEKLNFKVRQYPQRSGNDFVPGLSIIDALCYVGVDGTLELLMERNA